MRKIVDLCFYFLLKKKLGKSTFFLVLDKETPLRSMISIRKPKILDWFTVGLFTVQARFLKAGSKANHIELH